MRVGIVGCGLIGNKRAKAIIKNGDSVIWAVDTDEARASSLCIANGVGHFGSDYKLMDADKPDAVVIALPHNMLAEVATYFIEKKIPCLIEKPGAVSFKEAYLLAKASSESFVPVGFGYNMRHHRAFIHARRVLLDGTIGEITHIEAYYGHGGRKDYDKEWRMSKEKSGGGVLVDLGSHLIDLSFWLTEANDFYLPIEHARTENLYWERANVEDNAYVSMTTGNHIRVDIGVSCTEWKNTFRFYIYGNKGKIMIDGIGGSYGTETMTVVQCNKNLSYPNIVTYTYGGEDVSWQSEWQEFQYLIDGDPIDICTSAECVSVWRTINAIYAKTGRL